MPSSVPVSDKVCSILEINCCIWEFPFFILNMIVYLLWQSLSQTMRLTYCHNEFCIVYCNMNAFFSFDFLMVHIPECKQELWNNTWTLNLGCSFITLREPCDMASCYKSFYHDFHVKRLSNLSIHIRLYNCLTEKTVV